ncbi:CRISPR-associated protein Cas5 [Syntrophomonas palmitatica]|uniref:CRISPR-associated protein Cas5 n=1 Tax=Syntrophomonas palmitatica TaxID=402877 RepID=UPI00241CC74B|nr:CRISPR-associated protein Cas5 [Syntrophomonas palmitatica]
MNEAISRYDVAVKVWGPIACFTRPEFKVERVTYPVMTPSAARGVLEAICWKPEMGWEVREIWFLTKSTNMRYCVTKSRTARAREVSRL